MSEENGFEVKECESCTAEIVGGDAHWECPQCGAVVCDDCGNENENCPVCATPLSYVPEDIN